MTKSFGLAAALAAAFVMVVASVVLGHAALQTSDPANGSTIKTPYTLIATYDDELTPNGSSIVVQSAGGTQVANGTVSTTDDKQMTVDLPVLPDGQYTALWTAVTADDNGLTRGTFTFNVSSNATASVAPATPAPSAAAGDSTGSGSDLLIPIVVVVVLVAGIAAYFIYRNRR